MPVPAAGPPASKALALAATQVTSDLPRPAPGATGLLGSSMGTGQTRNPRRRHRHIQEVTHASDRSAAVQVIPNRSQ
jgi:hypothetical protein